MSEPPIKLPIVPGQTWTVVDSSSDEKIIDDMAALYAEVFNTVTDDNGKLLFPNQLWTRESAKALLKQRLQRPSAMIAIRDSNTGKLIGGFCADIMPGRDGTRVPAFDIFIAKEFRNKRNGTRLLYAGMMEANRRSFSVFGEDISIWEGQTYVGPTHPGSWWTGDLGFKSETLFQVAAQDLTRPKAHVSQGSSAVIRPVTDQDRNGLLDLMTHLDAQPDNDEIWEKSRAEQYLAFMLQHNNDLVRVIEKDGKITGCFFADTVPGRGKGAHLVEPLVFALPSVPKAEKADLLAVGCQAADARARQYYKQPLIELEMPFWSKNIHIEEILREHGKKQDRKFSYVWAKANVYRAKLESLFRKYQPA